MKKPIYKKWWFWAIAVIIIIAIGTGGEDEQKVDDKKKDEQTTKVEKKKDEPVVKMEKEEPEKKEEPKKKLTLKDEIVQSVENKLGKKTNMKKKRIVKLKVNDHAGTKKEGDKIVLLTLSGDENFTTKMTITGLMMDCNTAFQEVFKNNKVSEVVLSWQLPLVDAYGKSKDGNVLKITLTKETFNKIEWKNFDYNKYEVVADEFWMHPALRKELNN